MNDLQGSHGDKPDAESVAALEAEIAVHRRELSARWQRVTTTDRLYAVERLLRDDVLPPDLQAVVQAHQDRVRDAWARARAAANINPALVAVASLECRLTETARDRALAEHGLFDALFASSEGYLRPGLLRFKQLLQQREIAKARARTVPILPPTFEGEQPGA